MTPIRYDIIDRKTGFKVGSAKTRNGATRVIDRKDNEYGAYIHYAKPVYEGE